MSVVAEEGLLLLSSMAACSLQINIATNIDSKFSFVTVLLVGIEISKESLKSLRTLCLSIKLYYILHHNVEWRNSLL